MPHHHSPKVQNLKNFLEYWECWLLNRERNANFEILQFQSLNQLANPFSIDNFPDIIMKYCPNCEINEGLVLMDAKRKQRHKRNNLKLTTNQIETCSSVTSPILFSSKKSTPIRKQNKRIVKGKNNISYSRKFLKINSSKPSFGNCINLNLFMAK